MKVHIDYLENKVENMMDKVTTFDQMQERFQKKVVIAVEKFDLIKE
jgi:hypothetical protein